MNRDPKNLLQQVGTLKASCSDLGARLSMAAAELKDAGVPLSENLFAALTTYREDFASLRDAALQLAKSVPGTQVPTLVVSLNDIQGLLQTVAASSGIREEALKILDRVLAIVHRNPIDFPPLQQCQAKARELHRQIANSPTSDLPTDARVLAAGKHPFCGLLTLMEPPPDLEDDEWGLLVEVVARAFGKPLTVAASRGKLRVALESMPVSPESGRVTGDASGMVSSQSSPAQRPQVQVLESGAQSMPEVIVLPAWGEGGSFVSPANKTFSSPIPPFAGSAGVGDRGLLAADKGAEEDRAILNAPPPPSGQREVIVLPSYDESQEQLAYESDRLIFGTVASSPQPSLGLAGTRDAVGLKVLVHIERIGDREFGSDEFAGTRGQALRLQGFAIEIANPIPGLGMRYMAHLQSIGDTPWVTEGQFIGDRAKGLRLEGFAIELTGVEAANYNVFYQSHIQNIGDTQVFSNGQFCGNRGQGLRIEGMKVWIEKK